MNPWWKRPSPGEGKSGRRQRSKGGTDDQPSKLGDTLQDADDISELDGDLFEDDDKAKKGKKKRRRRRRSKKRGSGRSGRIDLVLCDLDAFAHTLNSEATDPEPVLAELYGGRTPGTLLAYGTNQGHSRLADAVAELGFAVKQLEEDQIATRMAIDAIAALESIEGRAGVLLIADHPSLGPLCEHLAESGASLFVHRSDDNPLAEACGLETPPGPGPRSLRSDDEDDADEDSDDDSEDGDNDDDDEDTGDFASDDDSDEEAEDDEEDDRPRRRRRSRSRRRGGRGGSRRRPADDEDDDTDDAAAALAEADEDRDGDDDVYDTDDTDDSDESDGFDDSDDERPRRGRRGGRGRRGARPSHADGASRRDPMKVLDDAMRELVASGPRVVWATLLRQECHRQAPGFDETQHGFASFHDLLEEAARRGLIELTFVEATESWVVSAWTPAA
ncbi:MAG: hypothetical protein DWQ36_11885 [Acidobacteria bacterium]|nr:MAG: hypothetical protein DWQ30_02770 [Acidobacteriota bacterium]REK07420.1 MAG: hypothetical protein DWQ36_11885 [Acidobacteriota bacterium]